MPEAGRTFRVKLVDSAYFLLDRALKRTIVGIDELKFRAAPVFRAPLGLLSGAIGAIAWLSRPPGSGASLVSFPFRAAIGIPLVILVGLFASIVALTVASLGAIAGFRNSGTYTAREQLAAWAVPAVLLILLPYLVGDLALSRATNVLTYAILLIGIDVLFGHCGIPTLGHAGFVTIGAYVTAWLYGGTFGVSVPFMVAVFCGGLVGAAMGCLLALPAVRIKDHHLSVTTLAFGLVLPLVLKSRYMENYSGLRDGGLMVSAPEAPKWLAFVKPEAYNYYLIAFSFAALAYFAYNVIRHSQIGRGFKAIKCDVEVAGALGVPVNKLKLLAFTFSAFYAAFAGGLFMLKTGFISPDSYTIHDTVMYNIAIMFGGLCSLPGAVIAGVFMTFEPEVGAKIAELVPRGVQLTYAFTGALMIVMLYFAPRGIAGTITHHLKSRFVHKARRGRNYFTPPPDYNVIEARGARAKSRHLDL